jgi:flagellar basal body P-ring formation protein FlgA
MRKILLLSTLLLTMPAQGAALRDYVSLASDQVRLSDLFDGLTPGQDRAIGTGPTPGNRIVVAASQLNAIAEEFGVDWHDGSGSAQIILERNGVPLQAQALMGPLREALASQGAPSQGEISLQNFAAPMVAPGDLITPLVGSLQYDQASGDFTALVTITGGKTPAQSLRVSGNMAEVAQIPVLARQMAPHEQIGAEDIRVVSQRLPRNSGDVVRDARQLIGQALSHVVPAGAPIPASELTAPTAIMANASVEMDVETGGLRVSGRGIAEQSGAVGDMIRVRNPASLAVMMAEVTGPNQVRVDPNSQPIVTNRANQEFAAQ